MEGMKPILVPVQVETFKELKEYADFMDKYFSASKETIEIIEAILDCFEKQQKQKPRPAHNTERGKGNGLERKGKQNDSTEHKN
jgi:hypothetical protein